MHGHFAVSWPCFARHGDKGLKAGGFLTQEPESKLVQPSLPRRRSPVLTFPYRLKIHAILKQVAQLRK